MSIILKLKGHIKGRFIPRILNFFKKIIEQLMNEAEYLMKNYGDRGGGTASTGNTLGDLHSSSYDTKAEFNNCFIIHSK